MAPPPARRESTADVLHGVTVADPYRWLEDGESAETIAWVEEQNARTRGVIDARPDRERWHRRAAELLSVPISYGCRLGGDVVFSLERGGGRRQAVLVARSLVDPAVPAQVLIDPADLADDDTGAIDWYQPSPEGRLIAYGFSTGGDERSTLRVLDVGSGEHLSDVIPETRAASVGWLPGAVGFLYTRYPEGDEYHRRVYEHRLGQDWHDDALVWDDLPKPEAWSDVAVSEDGRWALVHVDLGWSRTDVHLLDRQQDRWTVVVEGVEAQHRFVVDGDRLLGTTTLDAPRGRVVAAPLGERGAWTTLIPEGDGVIDGVQVAGGELLVLSTRHAVARLHRYGRDGAELGPIVLPEVCSFAGFEADRDRPVAVCQVESFTRPPTLLRWTPDAGLVPWAAERGPAIGAPLDADRFAIRQVRYRSSDGTSIGLFLVHRADQTPTADTPCLLTGYGGFAIAETPAWSPRAAVWCAAGGLYAVAGLRGGYEEGEAWHQAGRREHKQQVFDDFAAAAEFLVEAGLTSRHRLALVGGSNGGLLVGATLTQHPGLARAVWCAVPLLDMVRYPQFLIARLWTEEYGDPDIADEFAWLWGYSPYHHVVEGECYPAVVFTASEGDTRVDPLHARKMAALLQWASACEDEHPVLLRQEARAGHGVGKPLHKQADEVSDVLTFLSWQLGGPQP